MTYDELKQAQAAGAHIYGIEADGKLHRIENPGWSCPPDRYIAILPFDSDLVRDAERYRWLRTEAARDKRGSDHDRLHVSINYPTKMADGSGYTGLLLTPMGAEFDARVDAAIHAQAGGSES